MERLSVIVLMMMALQAGASAGGASCGEWEPIETPVPANAGQAIIRDITALTPDDAWAVGGYTLGGQSYAFTMHWNGQDWTLVETPQPAPCPTCHNITLWGVDALAPDNVWACGAATLQAPDGFVGTHMLVMHWDGQAWEVADLPIQQGASGDLLWDVEAIAPDDVWFFGENLYSGAPLLLDLAIALHWDGSGFELVEVPIVNFQASGFADGNSLRAADAIAADDMWAVGAGGDGDPLSCGLSQVHHWNGSQWTHVPAGPPDGCFDHSLEAVAMIASDDVWVGGESFDGSYHGLALHWDGKAWTEFDIPIGVSGFVAFASDDVWALGGGAAHWDGTRWTLVDTFPQVFGPAIAGADRAGDCQAWAGGRFIEPNGKLIPLTIRLTPTAGAGPDLNADGAVDSLDLNAVLAAFGIDDSGDTDADGDTDSGDLNAVLAAFGS